jgi:hypothetical protein
MFGFHVSMKEIHPEVGGGGGLDGDGAGSLAEREGFGAFTSQALVQLTDSTLPDMPT